MLKMIVAVLSLLSIGAPALAQDADAATPAALGGLDPVSYFPEGGLTPAAGDAAIVQEHDGRSYRFANERNRARFVNDPARYAPRFDGRCADHLAREEERPGDPGVFSIVGGRLYLFADSASRDRWLGDVDRSISLARRHASASDPGPTPRRTDLYNLDKSKPAVKGYDPVAYFPEAGGKPLKGKASTTLSFRGVTYRFATAANRDRFKSNPDRYEPAYGGWCAWAMAKDDLAPIDPSKFLISDGRLLLFFDGAFNDTRAKWNKGNGRALTRDADGHWAQRSGERAPAKTGG